MTETESKTSDYLADSFDELTTYLGTMKKQNKLQIPINHKFTNAKIRDLQLSPNYSNEQKKAMFNDSPLSLIVAGAGSGKSHTLIGRLSYLETQNVDLSKVLVCSYTNVAADNIINRFGDIQSMTISSFLQSCFLAQYPNADLTISDDDTFLSRLEGTDLTHNNKLLKKYSQHQISKAMQDLYQPYANVIMASKDDLHKALNHTIAVVRKQPNLFMDMFMEMHSITLTLQSIVLYSIFYDHNHHTTATTPWHIPDEYKDVKYIMIDEAQDTAILDYVLMFNIVIRLHANLTLIGDHNQTLYEFRDADPDMFMKLQKHHLFEVNKLTSNFRSRNEILMVPNRLLSALPSSDSLKITLHNDIEEPVTKTSFNQHVKMTNYDIDTQDRPRYRAKLLNKLKHDEHLCNWVIEKYRNNEQIGCMARNHFEVDIMCDWITDLITNYVGHKPTILELGKNADVGIRANLSKVMHKVLFEKATTYKPSECITHFNLDISNELSAQDIAPDSDNLYKAKQFHAIVPLMKQLNQVYAKYGYRHQSTGSKVKFITNYICDYEDKLNTEAYTTKQQYQQQIYKTGLKNAEVVTSTIHSAKGLEFDNAIVLCNESESRREPEADLRAYGVALSRARKNEYLINIVNAQGHDIEPKGDNYILQPLRTAYYQCQIDL